jgi:hypothetical protein
MPVYFSPDGGAEAAIVTEINGAMSYVFGLINMYQSGPIHTAILNLAALDIPISLIFDRKMQFLIGPRLDELLAAGVVCYWDKHEKSVQSQYLLIDDMIIFTGSYRWNEQYNHRYASDLYHITDMYLYQDYYTDWLIHQAHSELIT